MPLQYIADGNFQRATLGASLTSGATSITVTAGHGARFPALTGSGDICYALLYDTASPPTKFEVVKITARSTDTLTVIRGQDGTTGTAFSSGDYIQWVLSYSALDQLRADIVRSGTVAALPASGQRKQGDLYIPSDGVYSDYWFNGSVWVPRYNGLSCTEPVDGDFAWINQGLASVSTAGGGVYLLAPASSSHNWRIRKKAAPAAPYTITAFFLPNVAGVDFTYCGLLFRESGSGKLIIAGTVSQAANNGNLLFIQRWTNETTFSLSLLSWDWANGRSPCMLRMANDNTNNVWSISADGQNWIQVFSEAKAAFLTADEIGFAVNVANTSTAAGAMTLLHWKQT